MTRAHDAPDAPTLQTLQTLQTPKTEAMFADLHLHTHHSDGIRSPEEVVRRAAEAGLSVIAISDHDNLAAFAEAEPAAKTAGVTLLPGVELSITWEGIDVHVLAYAFDPDDAALAAKLRACRETREQRGERMVENLRALGHPITVERVREICGEGAMGRPHIARALVETGHVGSVQEAFDRFLCPGGAAWVEKERIELDEAVALVRDAGGVTSIAHPSHYPRADFVVETLLARGVDAVEVLHPAIPPADAARFEAIAARAGKMTTGGSDDHGFDARCSLGSVRVPVARVQPIVDRWLRRAR
ncbi:MAG: PHP domain-containing protein [Thermoanaerobaculia bacterium]